jgi:hypothetical protein
VANALSHLITAIETCKVFYFPPILHCTDEEVEALPRVLHQVVDAYLIHDRPDFRAYTSDYLSEEKV